MPVTLPIPVPQLTRVHTVTEPAQALTEFKAFTSEFITLLLLGEVPREDRMLRGANFLCLQETANEKQRVLWLRSEEEIEPVKAELEAKLAVYSPDETIELANVQALSIEPNTGKIAFLMLRDATNRKHRFSIFNMQRSFFKAIKLIPEMPVSPTPVVDTETDVDNPPQPTSEV